MREFSLRTVLTVTTGWMLTSTTELDAFLTYMNGSKVWPNEREHVTYEARIMILKRYPSLVDVVVPKFEPKHRRGYQGDKKAFYESWIATQEARFGKGVALASLGIPPIGLGLVKIPKV